MDPGAAWALSGIGMRSSPVTQYQICDVWRYGRWIQEIGRYQECPSCEGKGRVSVEVWGGNARSYECATCDGFGALWEVGEDERE